MIPQRTVAIITLITFLIVLFITTGLNWEDKTNKNYDINTKNTTNNGYQSQNATTNIQLNPWPEWIFYHWEWEDEGTRQSATQLVDEYLIRDIPVGAIIIDSP